MLTLSPFQTLPPHVNQLIVNYVVGSIRIVGDGIEVNSNEYRVLLRPLLGVCHALRAIAHPCYCSVFKLELAGQSYHEYAAQYSQLGYFDLGYRVRNDLGYSTRHLAKELIIELDERGIYSGNTLPILSCMPNVDCAFPLVRIITFLVIMDEEPAIVLSKAEDNICAFARRIKQLAPIARDIRVWPQDFDRVPSIVSFYFGSLVTYLFQLGDRVAYLHYGESDLAMALLPDKISNLVRIKYSCQSNAMHIAQLVRQNAPTLQYVDIDSEQDIDISGLIQAADSSSYVVYPHLAALKLWGPSYYHEQQRPVFISAIPFPCLQSLSVGRDYPFGDDTFFRGNAATLKYLEMWVDSSAAAMLCRYNVFTPASHPKLWCVKIGDSDGPPPDSFATEAEAMRFYLSIAPNASVREIKGALTAAETVLAFAPALDSRSACIQVLSLPFVSLTLWDVVSLIKSLPLLSDLHSRYPSIGQLPTGVALSDLPAYMRSTYGSVGLRFRCWHLERARVRSFADIAMCTLLLALICPNFDYAVTEPDEREPFMEQMEEEIATDKFNQYAPRLRRLLFHGWQGCQTITC
ncbi:hypothetical protein GGI00_000583 [Coemansia sp. RSA 2681]|nr:hypothetical protein GGI00_000583 [Coemansia sp. RSA 2681]